MFSNSKYYNKCSLSDQMVMTCAENYYYICLLQFFDRARCLIWISSVFLQCNSNAEFCLASFSKAFYNDSYFKHAWGHVWPRKLSYWILKIYFCFVQLLSFGFVIRKSDHMLTSLTDSLAITSPLQWLILFVSWLVYFKW